MHINHRQIPQYHKSATESTQKTQKSQHIPTTQKNRTNITQIRDEYLNDREGTATSLDPVEEGGEPSLGTQIGGGGNQIGRDGTKIGGPRLDRSQ